MATQPTYGVAQRTPFRSNDRIYLPPATVAGDINITHVVGILTLTRDVPTIQNQVAPSIGTLQLTGDTHTVVIGLVINATIGTLSLTRDVPTIGTTVVPTIGVLTLNAGTHTLQVDMNMFPSVGILRLLADGPTIPGGTPSVELITSRGGKEDQSDMLTHFIQVAFDKVRATTQSIKDVLR